MSALQPLVQEYPSKETGYRINNFSITVGTVNGSGSQTSNLTILRALFKMGIPVSGKNLFPSNIQGLPTWYTIRVNKDGFLARREEHEIVVAMNPATFANDLASVSPGRGLLLRRRYQASPSPARISLSTRCRSSSSASDSGRAHQPARLRRQHGLCWRPGADAGDRPGQDLPGAQLPLQGQAEAHRPELWRGQGGCRMGGRQTWRRKTPTASSRWTRPRG